MNDAEKKLLKSIIKHYTEDEFCRYILAGFAFILFESMDFGCEEVLVYKMRELQAQIKNIIESVPQGETIH